MACLAISIYIIHPLSSEKGGLFVMNVALRKHAYPNILKILPPKSEKKKNSDKNSDFFFHISDQNID